MTAKKNVSNAEMLKGTLDMMILRTLLTGDAHGHTIAKVIERTSEDVLEVEQGSLYPALHRLENEGMIESFDGPSSRDAENGRTRRYYRITESGRGMLTRDRGEWRAHSRAVTMILEEV